MGWTLGLVLGSDGLSQWRDVFAAVERHIVVQQPIFIGLCIGAVVLIFFIADVYLAKWLLRRRGDEQRDR